MPGTLTNEEFYVREAMIVMATGASAEAAVGGPAGAPAAGRRRTDSTAVFGAGAGEST